MYGINRFSHDMAHVKYLYTKNEHCNFYGLLVITSTARVEARIDVDGWMSRQMNR